MIYNTAGGNKPGEEVIFNQTGYKLLAIN